MLDERARRQLVEMGIDTYVLRSDESAETAYLSADPPARHPQSDPDALTPTALRRMRVVVSIVVDAHAPDAAIIDDVRRALRMAGVTAGAAQSTSVGQSLVVFGALPDATSAASDSTVMAGSVVALRGDPARKRALWRAIRALLRCAARESGSGMHRTD